MKITYIVLMFCLSFGIAQAQGSYTINGKKDVVTGVITGNVKDANTFQPLTGVTIEAAGKTALTDARGTFKLDGMKDGEIEVKASLAGYLPANKTIKMMNNSSAPVQLRLAPDPNVDAVIISEENLLKVKLTAEKAVVEAGKNFFVKFEAPDGFEKEAWIGIVSKDAPEQLSDEDPAVDSFKSLLNKVTGDLLFKAPLNMGEYEIRMYNKKSGGLKVATIPLKVNAAPEDDEEEGKKRK